MRQVISLISRENTSHGMEITVPIHFVHHAQLIHQIVSLALIATIILFAVLAILAIMWQTDIAHLAINYYKAVLHAHKILIHVHRAKVLIL